MGWLFKRSSFSIGEVLLLMLYAVAVERDHWWDASIFLGVAIAVGCWWRARRNIDAGAE